MIPCRYLCDSITNIHCDYRSILIGVYSKAIQTLMKKFISFTLFFLKDNDFLY